MNLLREIDYFSECKMYNKNFWQFQQSLPINLKEKFNAALKNSKIHDLDVMQGYKGPQKLRIDGSKYSATEKPKDGVQKIWFWFGVSSHVNWLPIIGTVAWGITKFVQHKQGSSDWNVLYFDASTGDMMLDAIKAHGFMQTQEIRSVVNPDDAIKTFKALVEEAEAKEEAKDFRGALISYKNAITLIRNNPQLKNEQIFLWKIIKL